MSKEMRNITMVILYCIRALVSMIFGVTGTVLVNAAYIVVALGSLVIVAASVVMGTESWNEFAGKFVEKVLHLIGVKRIVFLDDDDNK